MPATQIEIPYHLLFISFFIFLCFYNTTETFSREVTGGWPEVSKTQWGKYITWVKDKNGKWITKLNKSHPI